MKREDLLERIRRSGVPLIHEPDLRENVARRMAVYRGAGEESVAGDSPPSGEQFGAGRIDAFVNIGGNEANLGTSPMILDVAPGLNESLPLPPPGQRGVLYEMSERGVPVIHLLHVRGLALSHGLPWDPVPLPAPGSARLMRDEENRGWLFWLVTGGYFVVLLLIGVTTKSRRVKKIR